jgi:hypothetical protein
MNGDDPILTPEQLIDTAIADAISGPQKVSGDAGSAESYDLDQLIRMKQFLAGEKAGVKVNRGLRFTRLIPDGTVGGRW